jgi:drug/metabolite transporter (DMT)-like permease
VCARHGATGLVLGAVNTAIPYTLIAWGETHIDSGIAAIANSTVPIFVVLLAIKFRPSERVTGLRLAGIAIGLLGVGVLAGVHPEGGWWAVAGTLAVVLASLSYGIGGLYGQGSAGRASGPVLATSVTLYGGLMLLPFGLLQLPDHLPSWKPVASVFGLALLGTTLAQLIMFRLLGSHGASKTALVTYLMPPIALFYGAVILDEPVTWSAIAGLALILAGVALGSGVLRARRRASAVIRLPAR